VVLQPFSNRHNAVLGALTDLPSLLDPVLTRLANLGSHVFPSSLLTHLHSPELLALLQEYRVTFSLHFLKASSNPFHKLFSIDFHSNRFLHQISNLRARLRQLTGHLSVVVPVGRMAQVQWAQVDRQG